MSNVTWKNLGIIMLSGIALYTCAHFALRIIDDPQEEPPVETIIEPEPITPFSFSCWSGKTEMFKLDKVIKATRFDSGDWEITQQDSVERFYRPRGGEYCGITFGDES